MGCVGGGNAEERGVERRVERGGVAADGCSALETDVMEREWESSGLLCDR